MNELMKIAKESGLPQTQSQALLDTFQEFFGMTAEWEEKAKSIKVTDESQTEMMILAREGRKEMQQLRLKLDRVHKEQKKIPLLYGRAVDGMRNVLKLPIAQLEDYLDKQENFAVNKRRAELKAREEEGARLLAEKEAKEEKALQKKIEDERLENIRLKDEAVEKARLAQIETNKAVAEQKKVDDAAKDEREKHQFETEQKQRLAFEREEKLREENEKKLAAEREKQDAEKKELEKKRIIGQNRQDLLFKVDSRLDFKNCANMTDQTFDKFYQEAQDDYQSEQNRILKQKQTEDREKKEAAEKAREANQKLIALEKEKEKIEKEGWQEKSTTPAQTVKCPSCGKEFLPDLKLL